MTTQMHGVEATRRYLEEQGAQFEIVEHEATFRASDDARAAGVPADDTAKTVLVKGDEGYSVAVIPASERIDVHKLRELLDDNHVRLATEDEMQSDFPIFDVGAIPPFGPMLPAPELMDRRLLEHERVLCSAGDHEHSLLIAPDEIVRLASPMLADLCEE